MADAHDAYGDALRAAAALSPMSRRDLAKTLTENTQTHGKRLGKVVKLGGMQIAPNDLFDDLPDSDDEEVTESTENTLQTACMARSCYYGSVGILKTPFGILSDEAVQELWAQGRPAVFGNVRSARTELNTGIRYARQIAGHDGARQLAHELQNSKHVRGRIEEVFGTGSYDLREPKMSIYMVNGHFAKHRDTPSKTPASHVGTLVAELKTAQGREGGDLRVYVNSDIGNAVLNVHDKYQASVQIFPPYFVHEVTHVTQGCRVSVTMEIHRVLGSGELSAHDRDVQTVMTAMAAFMAEKNARTVGFLLRHPYSLGQELDGFDLALRTELVARNYGVRMQDVHVEWETSFYPTDGEDYTTGPSVYVYDADPEQTKLLGLAESKDTDPAEGTDAAGGTDAAEYSDSDQDTDAADAANATDGVPFFACSDDGLVALKEHFERGAEHVGNESRETRAEMLYYGRAFIVTVP